MFVVLYISLMVVLGSMLLFGLITIIGWFVYLPYIVKILVTPPQLSLPATDQLAGGTPCQFRTQDGVLLKGTYLPAEAEGTQGVIIFCHGFGGDRWNATPYVESLVQSGFDIFTFDFRNHGRSQSSEGYRPLHWPTRFELEDVRAAIDYCRQRSKDVTIGLLGVSRGGAVALCAAGLDDRVRAVVTDGAFPIDGMQRQYFRRFMFVYSKLSFIWSRYPDIGLWSFRVSSRFLAGLQHRCRFLHVERRVRQVRQPVFMIHGQRDSFVPCNVARGLRALLKGRSKLWIVPDAKHNGAISTARAEYHRRVRRFFARHLSDHLRPSIGLVKYRVPARKRRQLASDPR